MKKLNKVMLEDIRHNILNMLAIATGTLYLSDEHKPLTKAERELITSKMNDVAVYIGTLTKYTKGDV